MQKTKRALLHAIAEKVGGVSAEKIRTALATKTPIDDILDRPISEEEFASQLEDAERIWPKALARLQSQEWARSNEWGLN
ncbi:MAG TPA: hypothetical protein VF388_04220 [Lacunisphaera sp.]